MAKLFGGSILLLLPTGAMKRFVSAEEDGIGEANIKNRLHTWGNQRMKPVFEVLHECIGDLTPLTNVLDKAIYQPVISGRKVKIGDLSRKIPAKKSIQEAVSDAAGGDERDEDSDFTMEDA